MAIQNKTARTGRMLITGANGLLGREISRFFSRGYEILRTDREECDVTHERECLRVIGEFSPDVVGHGAAHTAVDRAEGEEEAAFALNAWRTPKGALASWYPGALPVRFGTAYVFDGTSE